MPIPKDRWAVGLRDDWVKFDSFSDAELQALAASGKEIHSIEDERNLLLSIIHGLSDDFSLGLHLPYVVRRGIREGHMEAGTPEVHVHGNAEGIGDLSLLGQYRFLRMEPGGADAAFLVGLKLPVGSTWQTDDSGVRFATEFQPGSGSWDPSVGIAVGRHWDSVSLDSSLLYAVATRGAQETDLGDALHFGAAISRRWIPAHRDPPSSSASGDSLRTPHHSHVAWEFILEAAGVRKQRQTVQGIADGDSGGTTVTLAPGLRINYHDRLSAYLSAGLPIFQDLNGTQHKLRAHIVFGIGAGF